MTGIALSVSRSAFSVERDWVSVFGPGYLRQCGPAFDAFDEDSSVVGRQSSVCGDASLMISCGMISYKSMQYSAAVSVILSPQLGKAAPCSSATPIGAVYIQGSINSIPAPTRNFVYSYNPGVVTSATVVARSLLGGSYYFVTYHPGTSSSVFPPQTQFSCTFSSALGYERLLNYDGGSASQCEAVQSLSVAQALSICDSKRSCIGIVTSMDGTSEYPVCLATVGPFSTTNNNAFYRKRIPPSYTCSHTMARDASYLDVMVTQTDFAQPGQFVTISVNNVVKFKCGGEYGFVGESARAGQCSAMAMCYHNTLFLAAGDQVSVTITSTVTSRGVCNYAAIVLFTPTYVTSRISTLFPPGSISSPTFTYRPIFVPTDSSLLSFYVPMRTVTAMALLMRVDNDAANYLTRNGWRFSAQLFSAFSTSSNSTSPTIPEGTFNCTASYNTFEGSLSGCGRDYLCSSRTSWYNGTNSPETVVSYMSTAATNPVAIVSYQQQVAWKANSCGQTYATGQLIFFGASVVQYDSFNDIRMLFVVSHQNTSTQSEIVAAAANFHNVTQSVVLLSFPFPFQQIYRSSNVSQRRYITAYDLNVSSVARTWNSSMDREMACVVDTFMDRSTSKACTLPVSGANFISVFVAQTQFANSKFSVTIILGALSITCGSGRTFQGSAGASGSCNSYMSCYQGAIPSGVTAASIIFTSPTQEESCKPAAAAVVKTRVIDQSSLTNCTSKLRCAIDQKCIPYSALCDGVIDCSDLSDEAYCTSWKLVSRVALPSCTSNFTYVSTGVLSVETCKAAAISYSIAQGSLDMSFLFIEDQLCIAFTCLAPSIASSVLVTIPPQYSAAFLYVRLEVTSDFALCTNELNCNNRGVVQSSTPPCTCVCYQGYIGSNCDSVKDITAISDTLVFTTADPLTGSQLAATKTLIEESLKASGATGVEASVTSYQPDVSTAALYSRNFDELAVSYSSYSATLSSFGTSAERSAAVALLLTQSGQSSFGSQFLSATGSNLVEISTPTLIVRSGASSCYIVHNRSSLLTNFACAAKPTISEYDRTISQLVVDYTITFYATLPGFTPIPFLDGTCDTITTSSTSTCSTVIQCYKLVQSPMANFSLKPGYKIAAASSTGPDSCIAKSEDEQVVDVDIVYHFINLLPKSTSETNRTKVSTESIITSSGSQAKTFMIILGVVGGVLLIAVYSLFRAERRFQAAFAANLLSVCVMGIIILLGIWYDAHVSVPSHYVVIDEFRSPLCSNSTVSPLPHRTSRVPADGGCHRMEVLGTSEGTGYLRANCAPLASTAGGSTFYTGLIEVWYGESLKKCLTATPVRVNSKRCGNESELFPLKGSAYLQFYEISCFPSAESNSRTQVIISEFKPKLPLFDTVPARTLVAQSQVAGTSGKDTFFRGSKDYVQDHVVGVSNAPLTAAAFSVGSSLSMGVDSELVRWTEGGLSDPPLELRSGNMANTSLIFRKYATPQESADASLRYLAISGTGLETGKKDFTITFWCKMSSATEGFIFTAVDNWADREYQSSPVILRVLEIMQNGLSNDNYFDQTWHMYIGLYANGGARTLSLLYANPVSAGNGGVFEMQWDVTSPKVNAQSLFDGSWHFVALGYSQDNGRYFTQLFVDGRTSYVDEGWRVCFPKGSRLSNVEQLPSQVTINSAVDESVAQGGVLYVGHANAGVFALQVHEGLFEQEQVIGLGSTGMKKYATIDVNNSLLLGRVLVVGASAALVIALIIVCCGACRSKSADVSKDAVAQSGANASKAAETITKVSRLNASASAASIGASQMRFMFPAVLSVAQTMALYFQGWKWPAVFELKINWAIFWLAFDINLSFPELPSLVSPAIQVFVAVGVLMIIFAMLGNDHEFFVSALRSRVGQAAGLPLATTHPELDAKIFFVPRYNRRKRFVIRTSSIPAVRSALMDTMRIPAGVTVVGVKLDAFGEEHPGFNCVLKATSRGAKQSILLTATFDLQASRTLANNEELMDLMLCDVEIEVIAPAECPTHKRPMMDALPSIHGVVTLEDGESPYVCAHSSRFGRVYRRLMKGSVLCPGRGAEFYVCQDDECAYCICKECWEGSTGDGVTASIQSKLYTLRRFGSMQIFGFIVLLVAQAVHMPIMKNALMIIFCHPSYQCDFPTCYSPPTTSFLVFVAFAVLICAAMGLGFVYYLFRTAVRRKDAIIQEVKEIHGRGLLAYCPPELWANILEGDNSMMKNLYEPYTFRFMWVQPITLVFKIVTVMPIVFANPNSLTQLTLCASAEAVQGLFFLFTNPFTDHWIGFLTQIGSIHQVFQLSLMCFHRVAITENPRNVYYATLMFYVAILYVVLIFLIIIVSVIGPGIVRYFRQQAELKKKKDDALKKAQSEDQGEHTQLQGDDAEMRVSTMQHHTPVVPTQSAMPFDHSYPPPRQSPEMVGYVPGSAV